MVSFNSHADNVDNPQSVTATYDQYYTFLPSLSRDGYTFDGWYRNYNATTGEYSDKVETTHQCHTDADETLHAKWTPDPYTVTFDANLPAGAGSAVWNASCFEGYNTATSTDNTRVFNRTYGENEKVFGNDCVNMSNAVTCNGYVITGWFTKAADGQGTQMFDNSDLKAGTGDGKVEFTNHVGSIRLYAHWREAYYCFMHADGGTLEANCVTGANLETTTDGYSFEIPSTGIMNSALASCALPQKTGYTCEGWFTKTGEVWADSPFDFAQVQSVSASVDVYAKWSPNPHTLTFNANGTTASPANFDGDANKTTKATTIDFDAEYQTAKYNNVAEWSTHFGVTRPGYDFANWYYSESDANAAGTDGVVNATDIFHNDNDNTVVYAGWAPRPYTLKLHAEGSTGYDYSTYPATFANNSNETTLSDVAYDVTYGQISTWKHFGATRTGFKVSGWKTADGHDRTDESVFHDGDTASTFALYAQWEPNEYTVTFMLNAPTGASTTSTATVPEPTTVTYAHTYGTLDDPTLTGYTFGGWFKEPACTGQEVTANTVYNPSNPGNHSLYAKWTANTCTVTFNGNAPAAPEGVAVTPPSSSETQTFDADYDLPADPTCPGYEFKGWYPNADGSGTKVTESTKCTMEDDHTLYAKWQPRTYHITVNSNGGSFSNTTTTQYYVAISYLAKYKTAKVSNNRYWENDFGGITRYGYQFAGWWTDPVGGVQRQDNEIYTKLGDEVLYAHWTPKTYTCTVQNYTQGDGSHAATINCSALVNSNTFTATFGQTFNASVGCDLNTDIFCPGFTKKWQRKTGNYSWSDFNPANTTWEWESNQTIRAVWEKDEDLEVTVYLDPNNGEVNLQSYTLKYWYGSSLRTNQYGIYHCNKYGYGCNNTNFLTQNVSISRTGYTFNGWWYNGERISNDTALRSAENHTLTADWIANDYTVTVHANGGTLPNACNACMTTPTTFKVKFDQPMNYYFSECTGCNINDVTREGYTFGGWYMNESCTGNALDFTGTWQAAYDADIYAKWTPNEYTVTLHSNGGHFNTEDTVFTATFDQAYGNYLNSTAAQVPVRDGWTFRGWYHENNATAANTEVFSGTPCTTAEDHTLYARWEKNITASVTMDSVSCYGYGNGVVKIDSIVGGEGDYYVTIKKGDTVFTQIVSHPAEGAASVSFDGATSGVAWHDSITTGNWDVYIYDASHYSTYQCEIPSYVENPHRDNCDSTYAGTGFDVCRLPVFRIKVEEPEPLAFTATASPQTCYNQGSVLVNVSGGNGQYTVSWTGSTGISSQSGSRELAGQYGTGWSASTNITGLLAQDVTLHVTDQKGCPVADQTVTIGQPTESVPTIDNVEKTVCSGQEFILPENRPVGVRYSWSTPAGTGCSGGESGDMMPSVNGTLTNTTNQEQVYTYQVTPSMGVHCTGTPFTVTVTVGPNRTEAPTTVEVTSPAEGCAHADRTLLAEFSGVVSNVTYQIDGGYGNGSMTAASSPDNTYNANIQLPDTCRGDIGFTVTAQDAYGCDVTGEGTLKVRIAPWSIAASTYGAGEVTCLAEAVEPTTHVPTNITDGCGNALTGELTATEYSTDNGAHWTASPFTCAGQVRYTYTFTACDNTFDVWTYTYTVTGMSADSVVVNEPLTSVDADVDATRCIFQVPNLKDAFLSRIAAASTCTAPSEVGFQQTPQAGSFISANTEVAVTLTDGCNRVSRYKVTVTVPTRPTLQQPITHGDILCHGNTTSATVAVTPGTGTPGYTYRWSDNSEEATAENLTAGSYTVTVTDANGCMAYGFVTLTEPSEIQFDIVLSDDTICDGDNVVVSANVSGGTYPYVYHWNQGIVGPVSPIQTLTESTEYTLQIEDANHCMTAVKKDTVIVNALPQVAITPADTHICAGGTATLTAVTADAVTYSWGSSDTYTVKPDSVAGVYPYSVTVTQTGGQHCVNTASVNVTVHTLPTTTIMNHPAVIAVNDSATVGVRPLEEGETVTWTITRDVDGTGGNAGILTPNVTECQACGVTDIKLQATSIGTVLVSATITQANNPTACNSITVTDTVKIRQSVIRLECPNPAQDSIVYDGLAHRIETSPVVTNNAGDTITQECTFTYKVGDEEFSDNIPERVLAGTTQVTVKASHDQYEPNTCTYSLTVNRRPVTVEVAECASWTGEPLTTAIAGHYTVAAADSTLLEGHTVTGQVITSSAAGGVYTYSDTAEVNTASKTNVRVMNGNEDMTDNYTVKVNARQTVMQMQLASVKGVTCNGKSNGEITVTTTPAEDTYLYYIGGNASSVTHNASGTETYNQLAAGTYSLYATKADGSCQTNLLANVTVNDIEPMTITPADSSIDICLGAAVALEATAHGGSMVYTYEWKDTRKDSVVGSTATVMNVLAADTTVYTLTVRDYSDNECFATANCTVNVRPGFPTNITAEADRVCLNETLEFSETLNAADPHCHYQWTLGDGENGQVVGSATNSMVSVRWSTPGTKQVIVNVTNDSTGCTSTGFYEITVDTLPSVQITTDRRNICPDQDSTVLVATVGEGMQYVWNVAGNPTTNTVKVGLDGAYTVTVTDGNGCRNTAVFTVGRYPLPSVQLNGGNTTLSICPGQETATLAATPVEQTFTYVWMRGSDTLNNGTPRVTEMAGVTTTGTYRVKVIDSVGCYAFSNNVTLGHNPIPVVEVSNPSICESGVATLTANGAETYTWSPTTYLQPNPTSVAYFSGAPAGEYTDTVRGVNGHGCWDTAVAHITVRPDVVLNINDTNLLHQSVCAGTLLDSIKVHVENGTVTLQGNLPRYVVFHHDDGTGIGNDTIEGITDQIGTFNYTLVATSNQTDPVCPSKQVSGVIKVNPMPAVTLMPATQEVCAGGDIDTVLITCTYGKLPETLENINGLVYERISADTAKLYGSVADYNLEIPVAVASTMTEPTCDTVFKNIVVTVHPNPVVKIASIDDVCPAVGTKTVSANVMTTTTADYTYYWTGGTWIDPMQTTTSSTSNQVTVNVPQECEAFVPLRVELTDAYGCRGIDSAVMVVRDTTTPHITLQSTTMMAKAIGNCKFEIPNMSESVTVTDECTFSTVYNIQQDVPAGSLMSADEQSKSVMVWVLGNCGHNDTAFVTVLKPEPVTVSITAADSICHGSSTLLKATATSGSAGQISFAWVPNTALSATHTAEVTASPLTSTTYTVTATDSIGCRASASTTLNIYPLPVVTLYDVPALCPNAGQATLSAHVDKNGGVGTSFEYHWTCEALSLNTNTVNGEDNQQTVTNIPNTCNGEYTVNLEVTENVLNCKSSASTVITVKDDVAPTITPDKNRVYAVNTSECVYTMPDLRDSLTFVLSDNGCTSAEALLATLVQSPAAGTQVSGSVPVQLTVTDACGNAATATVEVIVPNSNIEISGAVIKHVSCHGGSDGIALITHVTNGQNNYNFLVDNVPTDSKDTIRNLSAGTHHITAVAGNGCTSTWDAVLTEPDGFTMNITTVPATCANNDGQVVITVTGGTSFVDNGYSYRLLGDLDYGEPQFRDTLAGASPKVVANRKVGHYHLEIMDANGCLYVDSFDIALNNNLVIDEIPSPKPICSGGSFATTPLTQTPGTTYYTWPVPEQSVAGGVSGTAASPEDVLHYPQYTVNGTDLVNNTGSQPVNLTYHVTAHNGVCTYDTSVVMTVTTTVRPQVVITPHNDTVCPDALADYSLTVTVSNVYAEADTLTWYFNGDSIGQSYNTPTSNQFVERQEVTLTNAECNRVYPFVVEYTDGVCTSSKDGNVTVRIPDEFVIVMPARTDTTVNCFDDIRYVLPHQSPSRMPAHVYDGCGREVSYSSISSSAPFGVDCNDEVVVTYLYKDCSGNDTTYEYTYHVLQPALELPADGAATVICESDAVMPDSPGNQPDACNQSVTPIFPESYAGESNPKSTVVDGSGTVTYTFLYTTCDGQVYPWRFVYTVVPEPFTPFDTVAVNLHCKSAMAGNEHPVPVPDTTICGQHIDFTLNSNYPQDVFSGECGTRTYRYDYRVNGDDYEWYYIENVEPEDFEMPENASRTVACYSEINIGNIPMPTVYNACGSVLQPVSSTPVVTPAESQWNKCTDSVRCTYTYRDCAGHEHEWVYTWVVKDTLPPTFISMPEVVPAHRVMENGNCLYAYPTLDDVTYVVENACPSVTEMVTTSWDHQSDEGYGFWEYIEQTDEIQHLPVVVTATTCGVSNTATFYVEVPARLRIQELLSSHKNVKCFGGNDGEIRVTATGGTPGYTFSISELSATQTQPGYFTSLPVPVDSIRGTDEFGGIWYGNDTITVVDAHGCNAEMSVEIKSPVLVEWENCVDRVVLCADPGQNYRTVEIGVNGDIVPPTPSTLANNVTQQHTVYSDHYNVGITTIRYTVSSRTCRQNDVCEMLVQVLPNASVKDSADNAVQEACPNSEITPVVFTFANADSIVLTGSLPESMVSYETTQVTAYTTETQVTISGVAQVTEPTVYDYTFTAYSQAAPGTTLPCSEVTYSGAITVLDTVAPTYTRPENAEIYLSASCDVNISTAVTGEPTELADNCSDQLTVTFRDEAPVTDCGGAYHFNRVWRVVDPSGNVSRSDSIQVVTVRDTVRPVIASGYPAEWTAQPNLNCNSNVPLIWSEILNNFASDNCNAAMTAYQVPAEGEEILEDTDVVVTVEDGCGNSASVTVHVTAAGVMAIVIDSVDAGCYHSPEDGAVFFTIQGDAEQYNAIVNGRNFVLPVGANRIDGLPYGDSLVVMVMASMPHNPLMMCQSVKYFSIHPIADTLSLIANSHEWEYDNAEHQDPTFTVKYAGNVIATDVTSGSEVELPNHDRVKATITGSIKDAGTVANAFSDVTVLRGSDTVTCKYNQVLTNGTLTVTPADITVTITGHNLVADFDGEEHVVSGYDVEISDIFYTRNDFVFSGDSLLNRTNAGTDSMHLAFGQFQDAWPTPNNIGTVNFIIAADGYLTVNKINATVNIAGHQSVVDYDGYEHQVNGYETIFSTPLYSRADFDFTGDSLLTRTNAGIDSMHLAVGQFSNHNGNFDTVTFVIDQDGFLKVNPIDVTVTVTGHNNTADYDNAEHVVTGYDLEFSTPLYTAADFTFTGSDTAKRTFAGTTSMGLAQGQFANINPNFAEVTFNVTDGYQTITPVNAVVTVVGNTDTVDFDGMSHTVTGYVATATPAFYNVDTSFTFSGDSTATRTNAGTTVMGLAPGQFANINPNFAQVDFNVTDGSMNIRKIDVTVTVTGHHDVVDYNGEEHTVSGYDLAFSTPLYTRADFAFTGDSALALTNAGTVNMNLNANQFTNTNTTNFGDVNFVIAADGYLTINKIDVTVTVKGQRDTAVYDGQLHSVSGYEVQYSAPGYTADYFAFNGTAAASRTHVVEGNDQSGVTYMGLTQEMFTNLNTVNFNEVNFVVEDGYQRIDPLAVTVAITGHKQYNLYDGQEHVVSGFDTAYSTNLYTAADFTFTPAADADLVNGVVSARRTEYDTTYMGLAANQFVNHNTDFDVSFAVEDGFQAILTKEVTVTIVGHHNTADYDGDEHTVTGYDVTTNNALYTAADFDFTGDSTATLTNAGTVNMGLAESQFSNHNQNFGPVHFVVTDGYQTINKIDVEVAVKGTRDTVDYDGGEHTVTGYELEFSTPLYKTQYVQFGGQVSDSTASRTDAGTQWMGLAANMFSNISTTNFNHVTFTVAEDGAITVLPIDATVTITGNHASNEYDAAAHTVTGYTASANTTLYDVTTSFTFNGEATATRTMVDTTWMGLTGDMFANTNPNFATVTFNVVDGYQAITPANAVVTIKGNIASNDYDGTAHTVTGYTATAEPAIYDVATSFTFSGDSTATRTHVKEGTDESGKTYMGLANTMFVNTNPNFATVNFVIDADGYQQINPIGATVTITGHNHSALFDQEEHSVSGFDTAYSTELYSGADFTFTPAASLLMIDGKVAAKRTMVGTTYMGLADTMFKNTNTDFANVTFDVIDGYQKIEPRNVVVTITGHNDTVGYNGAEQRATGYDVSFSNEFYTEADFEFQGNPSDSIASGTYVGTYAMNLQTSQFVNVSVDNFDTVTFVVINGSLTIEQVPATVTITGKQSTVNYDGDAHTVTGYTAVAEPSFYDVTGNVVFNGSVADSTATRTNVVEGADNSGKTYMNLASGMFANTNANFSTVNFVIAENGYQAIAPINATVNIVGENNTADYDGAAHTVTGYVATASTPLYDVANSFVFNGTVADSTATRTNVVEGDDNSGKTYMGMTDVMFVNTNTNFAEVTFNVTDGYQVINPINAEVVIVGNHVATPYDGAAHTISGYVATANTPIYDVAGNIVFNGTVADSTATRTNVVEGADNSGKTAMGLTNAMFENISTNFATVTFNVTDGYQEITPREVTVTVKGHVDTFFFDNTPKQVSGFDVTIGDPMYAATNYSYDGTQADSMVTESTVGTFYMNLQGKFSNHNDNFDVTFDVTNGHLAILSNDVVVTIRGNHESLTYNGQAQTVTGYEVVSIDHPTYTADDFKFTGTQADSTASRTYIGTDSMGLTADMFENINDHYSNVTFVIEQDGFVTVTPGQVVVMVTGNNDTADYNGAPHTVTGFELSTVSTLYDLTSCVFQGTTSDSTATRTDAGTTYMGLNASQFVNTDTNAHVILFVVDGYQYVKKDTVWVTVTGAHNQAPIAYDTEEHTVTGYTMISSNTDYNPYAYVMFTGTATASRTDAGTTYMGLNENMFSNTNVNYHVIFNVIDGYVKIMPYLVGIEIRGNEEYVTNDGAAHTVHGYTMSTSCEFFDLNCVEFHGQQSDTTVTGSQEGESEYLNNIQSYVASQNPEAMFRLRQDCVSNNYEVRFTVLSGKLVILPADSVVVTITGHRDTVMYDGLSHTVSGYDWVASIPNYTVNDFTFDGDSTITKTDAGTYYSSYAGGSFHPAANSAYQHVGFQVHSATVLKIKKIDTMAVTVKGDVDTVTYDGQAHTVTGYTLTANTSLFDASNVVFDGSNNTASRTVAGTTNMGLVASQFSYSDNNFSNVTFVVNDGHVTVNKAELMVKSPDDVEFHKVYDGTPLVVTYDQLQYNGLVAGDEITQGVITSESAAVGSYVCGAGQMWSYAENETGVAVPSGFGEPSVTQNYKVHFNVTLRIDPVTELNCPEQLNIVLLEGTADTSLTDAQLGTIDNELVTAGVATVKSNIETINPLSVGTHIVTWTIYDVAGTAMTTCDQIVVVEYAPCQAVSYNGYTYPAKRIGAQCWMTENLRTQSDAEGNNIADYHPYKDNVAEFQKFGYLYTWYSAVGVAENTNMAVPATQTGANGQPYVQGICPEGWAVPSVADYQALYDTVVDVLLLKDAGDEYWYPGMGGVLPNSGFNSRAGGFYNSQTGRYEDLLTGDHYWKSDSVPGSTNAESGNVNYFCDSSTNNQAPKTDRRSVRCIKKM